MLCVTNSQVKAATSSLCRPRLSIKAMVPNVLHTLTAHKKRDVLSTWIACDDNVRPFLHDDGTEHAEQTGPAEQGPAAWTEMNVAQHGPFLIIPPPAGISKTRPERKVTMLPESHERRHPRTPGCSGQHVRRD